MKQKYLLLLIGIILFNLPTNAYWHNLYNPQGGMSLIYNVVGDSNALYAGKLVNDDGMLLKSTDLGRNWDTLYDTYREPFNDDFKIPFKYLQDIQYTGPRHLYLLYSYYDVNLSSNNKPKNVN